MKAIAVAALLVLSLLTAMAPSAGAATTSRTLVISTATSHPQVAFSGFDGNPPKLFDVDRDGHMEIIAQNDNQWTYVFDSQTGEILSQLRTTLPGGWGARSFNGPEMAIFDSSGTVRLIVMNSAAQVTSFRFDKPASTSHHFAFVKEWELRLTDCYSNPGSDSKPVLADLDKDGRYEIVVSTEESGLYALRETGQVYWRNCLGGGNAEPTVGDINLDGWPDVVFGSDGGVVSALNGRNGNYLWTYSVLAHHALHSASMPVGVAIGQLDGKLGPDVVVGVRDSHNATDFSQNHAMLLALDSGGRLLWARQDPTGNPLTYTHAIIADAASDGQPEVYWGDWNTMGHKPPYNEADAWKVTGPAHFYRYAADGTLVWRQTLDTYWSNKDLALADVTGDGVQDVLANGPGPGGDGIWYLDSRTGAKQAFVGTSPWQVARAPVIADLWGTGTMQWVVEVGPADASVSGGGILVYDTHAAYNAKWPHLPDPSLTPPPPPPPTPAPNGHFNATFTIANPNEYWQQVSVAPNPNRALAKVEVRVGGDLWRPMQKQSWGAWTASVQAPAGTTVDFLATDGAGAIAQSLPFTWMDGTMSRGTLQPGSTPPPPPPPPPPPTGGPFNATFTIRNPNEWWQQVDVAPATARPINRVDVRVAGGAWRAMALNPWGAWTSSHNAPAGTSVEFLATDSTGGTSQSAPFTWLDGTTTKGSVAPGTTPPPPPPPPPPGTFNATFAPTGGVNEWWIEAKVTANGALAGVDARVNGGTWTALAPTSYGTWAKSIHAEAGSKVRFRATSTSGATSESADFRWLSSGTAFTPTFTPRSVGNDWWVEVAVSGGVVAKVEASSNGGGWTDLPATGWGSWAKSYLVPDGTQVRFRATDDEARTATSASYAWI